MKNTSENPHLTEQLVSGIISHIGEDPSREGLKDTPRRVVKMWREIFAGYSMKPEDVMTTFAADGSDELVLVKDIDFHSMCEHHMMPFFGKVHVAYIPDPNGKLIGISKLARLVEIFSRRLQIQERIGEQITEALMKHLEPLGAACIIEGTHTCMTMRGIKKPGSMTITSSMRGVFKDNPSARQELLSLIG